MKATSNAFSSLGVLILISEHSLTNMILFESKRKYISMKKLPHQEQVNFDRIERHNYNNSFPTIYGAVYSMFLDKIYPFRRDLF